MGRRMVRRGVAVVALAMAGVPGITPPASATFPGIVGLIVTEGSDGTIRLVSPSGFPAPRVLTTGRSPAMSPDGRTIAFERKPSGEADSELFTIRADGANLVRLTYNTVDDIDPAWSPFGNELVYSSRVVGSTTGLRLYKIGLGKGHPAREVAITNRPSDAGQAVPWAEVAPDWSADGRWIVFVQTQGRTAEHYDYSGGLDIKVVPAAGGHANTVSLAFSTCYYDFGLRRTVCFRESGLRAPSFSPNSSAIVYEYANGFDPQRAGVRRVLINGSGLRERDERLAGSSSIDHRPVFSPSGTKVVLSQSDTFGSPGNVRLGRLVILDVFTGARTTISSNGLPVTGAPHSWARVLSYAS